MGVREPHTQVSWWEQPRKSTTPPRRRHGPGRAGVSGVCTVKAAGWLLSHDTGTSSKAIFAAMLGARPRADMHPHDPADLGRCLRLLRLVPEWQPRIEEMADFGQAWARLATHWDALAAIMEAEVGIDWTKGRSAPVTGLAMRRVLDGGKP